MLKIENLQKISVQFVDPTKHFTGQFKKSFDFSSLIPEIKNYQKTKENLPNKIIRTNTRSRTGSSNRTTTNKKPKKIPTVFIKLATIPRPDVLHSYLSYTDIMLYLDYLKVRFVDFVKIHTLGFSFERRPIKCIEINWNSERNLWAQPKEFRARSAPVYIADLKHLDVDDSAEGGRNIVFIEGGTHAREWISITVALNCIHQLTEKNVRHRELLRKLKFYIVPLVNPDGYEYARNTISPIREKPFSEPETRALATILHKLAPKLLLFLSLHSYAQSIMYPWGYTKLLTKNSKLMESVAIAGRNAIKAFSGRYYRVGSISQITKRTIAGSVVDYAYGAVKIPLTLVMELPANEYGFQPPTDKINPLGTESWQGIREMCKKAYSLKPQIDEEEAKKSPIKQPQVQKPDSNRTITNDDASKHSQNDDETPSSSRFGAKVLGNLFENTKVIKPQFNINSIKSKNCPNSLFGGYISSILDVKF